MPTLSLQSFSALVKRQGSALQGAASAPFDLSVGSVLRALIEANASLGLWLQWLIVLVLKATRASTSEGSDLDTWCADFSLTRAPAAYAAGMVTFSRYSPVQSAIIFPGVGVKTVDGTQSFVVTTDTAQPSWNNTLGGYFVAANVASVTVPVVAVVAGSSGNILAGTVSLISTASAGFDTVTNALPFVGGADAEADANFRTRFQNFINTRSLATINAIKYAIAGVQANVLYQIAENLDTQGNTRLGFFTLTVDDGTGNPPDSLLSAVYTAVDAVRPIGTSFAVQRATSLPAFVQMTISVIDGYNKSSVETAIVNAVTTYVDAIPIGSPLLYGRLFQIAYDVPGVAAISQLTLNGGTADMGGTPSLAVRIAVVSVS